MIFPGNKKVAAVIELLEQTGLFTSNEISLMEGYLLGETDEKVLEQLCYRDMSHIGKEMTQKAVALLKECTDKEVAQLGDLLFAVGGTSVYALFHIPMFRYSYCDEVLALEPAKKAAIYAACIAGNGYLLDHVDMQRMMKLTGNQPAIIKEAMEYEKDTPGGELILLAAYFLLKYPVVEMGAGAERELVVQALAEWDSEGYRPMLAGALEKEKSRKVRTFLKAVLQIPKAGQ